MLELKTLKFCNIGRFVKEQVLDISGMDKLIEVGALNNNTGGSSGAGKSTVFYALDYLLNINDIPTTSLQSRLTKDSIYAIGEFNVNGVLLTIKRSKKEGLYIKYGDEEVSGNVKLAEERLDEIIGIDRKLFKKMVHKKQKEGGFFLNLTAKESYDFLMKSLGLEKITSKSAKVDEDIKSLTSVIAQNTSTIQFLKESVSDYENVLSLNEKPVCDVDEGDLKIKNDTLLAYKQQIEDIKKSRDSEVNAIVKPIKDNINIEENVNIKLFYDQVIALEAKKRSEHETYKKEVSQAQEARSGLESKLQKIPFYKTQMKSLVDSMTSLISQKKHIEEQKCPTCAQKWVGETAEDKIKSINLEITNVKSQILEKKVLVDEEEDLNNKLTKVKEIQANIDNRYDLNQYDSEITKLKEEIVRLKSEDKNKLTILESEYLNKLNTYNTTVNDIKARFEKELFDISEITNHIAKEIAVSENSLANYKLALKNYEEKETKLKENLKTKKDELTKTESDLKEKTYKLSVAEEAKRVIKTYTLQIFQDTLDSIGSYASEMLAEIPNMSNATIYFEGCKENKSGTIKDEVNAIINMDGYDDINIKTLSGGERTAIDLAVDLAVIDMIESRVGKGANFFILDEPFEGLEEINISQCLDLLKQIDTNKRIIIVDHNPIVKEMITDKILIQRDGEESVVL